MLADASAGCTLVIGERPDPEQGGDADAGAAGEPDRAQDEPDADATPAVDGSEGGSDASNASDSGAPEAEAPEAGASGDAGSDAATEDADAAMDAGSDTGSDAAGDDTGASSDTGAPDSGPGCTNPTSWYPDDDEDGYGRSNEARQACAKPGSKWSDVGGDCRDSNADVHPNQATFFPAPYSLGAGLDSFDYNCSGKEDGNPGQSSLEAGCGALLDLGLLCNSTSGYSPSNRTGAGLNAMCGSEILVRCQVSGLSCVAGSPQAAPTPYTCR